MITLKSLLHPFGSLSIRTRLVLILLFLGLGGELLKTGIDGLRARTIVADEAERSLRTTLYRTEGILERFLADGRPDDVQWLVSIMAVRDESVQAAVIGADGTISAASRRDQRGLSWDTLRAAYGVPSWTVQGGLLAALPGSAEPPGTSVRIHHGTHSIIGATPICTLSNSGLRITECYTYIQAETTEGRYHDLLAALLREAAVRSLVVIVLAVGLWLTLGTSVVRRARTIVSSAHAFESGALASRSGVTGRDELGRIGEALDRVYGRLGTVMRQTIEAFSANTMHSDPYTAGHEERVAHLCVALGQVLKQDMGLDDSRLEGLEIAARAHDIGQAKIPSELLLRPRRLGEIEFAFIRQHADVGADILGTIDFPWPVADIVRQHHENYDGSGYPKGLAGDAILPEARILRVADMLEALSSHRPFRNALPWVDALERLRSERGRALDPVVVDACLRLTTAGGYRFPGTRPQDALPHPSSALPPLPPVPSPSGPLSDLHQTLRQTIEVLSSTLESRDPYTAGHERRVADIAVAIAAGMGLDPFRIEGLRLAATVHDIGKIQIPLRILSKPGRLSDIEYALIRTHPGVGHDILRTLELPWPVAEMVHQHHELLDGSGYPHGLKGEEILLEARILTVADIVESMSAARPYRPALGIPAALTELRRRRGVSLDPDVVDACLAIFGQGDD